MPTTPHHFVGQLVEADCAPLAGLHQISVRLIDDDGASHVAYMVHGRGADAERRCEQAFAALQIGQRYHGSATLQRTGEPHTYHFGSVVLAADRRRARFEPAPRWRAAA